MKFTFKNSFFFLVPNSDFVQIIKDVESNNEELRRSLMNDVNRERDTDELLSYIMSDYESQDDDVELELEPKVFNLIDHPYYETNRFKDTIQILNDQKNLMLHLEAVRIRIPVIFGFFCFVRSQTFFGRTFFARKLISGKHASKTNKIAHLP